MYSSNYVYEGFSLRVLSKGNRSDFTFQMLFYTSFLFLTVYDFWVD